MSDKLWPVLKYGFTAIIALSITATAYVAFVQKDYEIFGVWTEFEEGVAYTEYYYSGEYYEIETKSYEVDDIFNAIAADLEIDPDNLSDNTYYATEYAVDEAYYVLEQTDSEEEDIEDMVEEDDASLLLTDESPEDAEDMDDTLDEEVATSTEIFDMEEGATSTTLITDDLVDTNDEEI